MTTTINELHRAIAVDDLQRHPDHIPGLAAARHLMFEAQGEDVDATASRN